MVRLVRKPYLVEKVVVVDGQNGCGKTMLSSIIAALDRVELLSYAYQIEHICSLFYLKRIDMDVAETMIHMWVDLQLYNTMMGRETNFRTSDLSSVFRYPKPLKYIKRIFKEGDECIPAAIKKQRPILNLTTHNLLGISAPVFSSLGQRIVLIEVVRHPLYMIKQQTLNMERLLSDVRFFTIHFQHNDKAVPFWVFGYQDKFLNGNNIEKAIYVIEGLTRLAEAAKEILLQKYQAQIIAIPFESFVLNPWPYLDKITQALETKITAITLRAIKRQHVPRKMYADGIGLKIYKRCGWEPPQVGSDENREFQKRWQFAEQRASKEAMQILNNLCVAYEEKYMGGIKKTGESYE